VDINELALQLSETKTILMERTNQSALDIEKNAKRIEEQAKEVQEIRSRLTRNDTENIQLMTMYRELKEELASLNESIQALREAMRANTTKLSIIMSGAGMAIGALLTLLIRHLTG
jgi:uncharacterized coiled-coil DUF342 family protein